MISKAKLKELSAYKQQKHCEADGVFVAEGVKLCDEALREGQPIRVIVATGAWLEAHEQQLRVNLMTLRATAAESGAMCWQHMQIFEVNMAELERVSGQQSPNQVWMLIQRPAVIPSPTTVQGLTLVLDRLQDPGNMGTLLRSADWFGVRQVVCSPDSVSCYNPKVVQSSMGAVFRTQVCYTDLPTFLQGMQGCEIYGAVLHGDNVFDMQLCRDALLVIGNESRGLSPEVAQYLTHRISIPNVGGTCESLNAAVAAAILCARFCV